MRNDNAPVNNTIKTMNALEDQVLSLTRLADSPIAPIPLFQMNGQQNSPSAVSPAQDSSNSNGKRKADEESGSGGHTRAKRNRYISIACDQCKRRKIKVSAGLGCLDLWLQAAYYD